MHNYKTTRRAFKLYHSYNPHYFPLRLFHILFTNLTPFFTLWMSAEIVTALYEKKTKEELFLLVAIALCGALFIHIMGALLGRCVDNAQKQLENNEAAAFNKKTLSLDYDKLENPDIRQHRRNIKENAYINYYGVVHMRMNVGNILNNVINIVFALILFVEMVSLIATVGFGWIGVLLLVLLVVSVAMNILCQSIHSKKVAEAWNEVGKLMLDENRLGRGYDRSGMDNRIYRQQKLMDKLNIGFQKRHLETFAKAQNEDVKYSVPVLFFQRLSELMSYLIICFYCVLGAFPVGGVIKYVGYLASLTGCIGSLFYCLLRQIPMLPVLIWSIPWRRKPWQGIL